MGNFVGICCSLLSSYTNPRLQNGELQRKVQVGQERGGLQRLPREDGPLAAYQDGDAAIEAQPEHLARRRGQEVGGQLQLLHRRHQGGRHEVRRRRGVRREDAARIHQQECRSRRRRQLEDHLHDQSGQAREDVRSQGGGQRARNSSEVRGEGSHHQEVLLQDRLNAVLRRQHITYL